MDCNINVAGDRWVLSSAVQKLIRRGRAVEAVDVARRLEPLHPGYLRRRLQVIAYEEVGVAASETCLEVVDLCQGAHWDRAPEQAAARAIQLLADADKSRAACDAACLFSDHPEVRASAEVLLGLPDLKLLSVAADRGGDWASRLAALGLLHQRRGRSHSRPESVAAAIADAFELTEPTRALLTRGRGESVAMAAMLPVCEEVLRESQDARDETGLCGSDEAFLGVPLCALDRHSRPGCWALAEFARQSGKVRDLRDSLHGEVSVGRALGCVVFMLDSCALRRHVYSPETISMRQRIDALELAQCGVPAALRGELCAAVRADAAVLNEARRQALRRVS